MLVRSGAVDVVAVDSVAALTPRAELEGQMGDQTVGLQARMMSQAMRKLAGNLNRTADAVHLHQPDPREGRRDVRLARDPAGRPGAEVLLVPAPGHPPHRDAQGRHRGGRQPRPREGRQEQGGRALPPGRVRHRVRPGHLDRGLHARPRASSTTSSPSRARSSPTASERIGQGRDNAKAYLDEHPEIAQGDRGQDLRGARHRAQRPRDADRPTTPRATPRTAEDVERAAAEPTAAQPGPAAGRCRSATRGARASRRASSPSATSAAATAPWPRCARHLAARDVDAAARSRRCSASSCEQGYLDDAALRAALRRGPPDPGRLGRRAHRAPPGASSASTGTHIAARARRPRRRAERARGRGRAAARAACPEPPATPRDLERALGVLVRKGYELELAHDALRAHGRDGQTGTSG